MDLAIGLSAVAVVVSVVSALYAKRAADETKELRKTNLTVVLGLGLAVEQGRRSDTSPPLSWSTNSSKPTMTAS